MILAVPATSPARTLKEFLALAIQRSTDMNYGSVGNGSLSHLTGEYFNSLAGLKLTHVPYKGGAPMSTALASGEVQAAFVTGLDGAAMVSSGKVRYLAVGTPQRSAVVSGLPAIAEEVPGFRSIAWFGVLGPRGMPAAVAQKLHEAVVAAVAQPEVRKMLEDRNVEARTNSSAEMEEMIKGEMAQWGEVIKRSAIKIE
jgi:tripartite-type tricarboxylate transporter receptor subunit TctC